MFVYFVWVDGWSQVKICIGLWVVVSRWRRGLRIREERDWKLVEGQMDLVQFSRCFEGVTGLVENIGYVDLVRRCIRRGGGLVNLVDLVFVFWELYIVCYVVVVFVFFRLIFIYDIFMEELEDVMLQMRN